MERTVVIGLTGQTGAGKSTVGNLLRKRGVEWVDADAIARDVADEEKLCLANMALEFTIEILKADGSLNRKKLAEIVFNDKAKLKKLNEIIFPFIIASIEERIRIFKGSGTPYVVLDAPTLFESGANKFCDVILAVVAQEDVRAQRIMFRDKMTQEEAMARIKSQHSEGFYVRRANYIIRNDGSFEDLRLTTLDAFAKVEAREFLQKLIESPAGAEPLAETTGNCENDEE